MTRLGFGMISIGLFLVALHTTAIVDANYLHRYLASAALLILASIMGAYSITGRDTRNANN